MPGGSAGRRYWNRLREVGPPRARGKLAGLFAVWVALLWAALPAHAVNECGAGATVTCTSAGNPYANGITYSNPTESVTLATGVIVNSGANIGVDLIGTTGAQSVTLATGVSISTTGDNAGGVFAQSSGVGALVKVDTSAGSVGTLGGAANGIAASSTAGPVTIIAGSVTTQGFLAEGVFGSTLATGANGALTIDTTAGTVSTQDDFATGINAESGFILNPNSGGTTIVRTASVSTQGDGSDAILAMGQGGSINIDTTRGTISASGAGSNGINVQSFGGPVTVTTADVSLTNPSAGFASAIAVTATGTGATGQVMVDSTAGTVSIAGDQGFGINASSQGGPVTVTTGAVSAPGAGSIGILANSFGGAGNGTISVTAQHNVSATGETSTGIVAFSGGADLASAGTVDVTVAAGATVMGGWQASPADVGCCFGPPAGVIAGGAPATGRPQGTHILNNGTVGALSDLAVASADLFGLSPSGGGTLIENAGTITGFVTLGPGANVFNNHAAKSFDIRNFADTNGDGIRDTKAVSISDFGGPGASFDNLATGTVKLLSVPGSTTAGPVTVNTTGFYLPAGLTAASYDMTQVGVEQGHLVNLATFRNSGVITMQDAGTGGTGPVAGDVLVITGGAKAGTPGGGVFISDGGQLHVDTVLNAGGAQSRSDILVVDGTQVAAGGATKIFVANAGGIGAKTVGDGIKVVDVLTPSASAPGAFVLGAPVTAGAFTYSLFEGGVADPADGDWYLRSFARSAVALYSALPAAVTDYGFALLGTYHERMGQQDPAGTSPAAANGVWARAIGEGGRRRSGSADPRASQFDFAFGGFQGGFDLFRAESAEGTRDRLGFHIGAGLGSVEADKLSGARAGSLDFNAYSAGLYWTHIGASGWYLDAIAAGNFYTDIHATSAQGDHLSPQGWGAAASLEAGYPVAFADGWALEPQAQLVYQDVSLDRAQDANSRVSFADAEALRGRLGLRLVKTWSGDDVPPLGTPAPLSTWVRANLGHEFLDRPRTTVSTLTGANPMTVHTSFEGSEVELELGVTGRVSDAVTVFGTGHVGIGFAGASGTRYGGRIGLRVAW